MSWRPFKPVLRVATGGAAALLALQPAGAQSTGSDGTAPNPQVQAVVEEVLVTASRRATDINDIPYNISAVGADQLARTNTIDLATLAQQVPGFTFEDRGARFAGATVPIIRGLNASNTDRQGLVQEQMPVGTYIGNSPVVGYFPLDDVQRVEVLRGPQGTLYGAGALGGAIRVIPNDPQLNTWSADVGVSGSTTAHSSDPGYSASGVFNAPLGEIAALRLSGKYEHQSGFIDQKDILARTGNAVLSAPVLADPTDVANSPGVYVNRKNMNYTDVRSFRASVLIQPIEDLKVDVAYNRTGLNGFGGPVTNPAFQGGTSPFDSRITLAPGGAYTLNSPTLQPYTRASDLVSVDVSYDMGFATLASTSSYRDTKGYTDSEATFSVFSLPAAYLQYYVGNPISPRFVDDFIYHDATHSLTEEVRLVSKAGGHVDYVLGLYYENMGDNLTWDAYDPGASEQAAASGGFPVVTAPPYGHQYSQLVGDSFKDKSIFGEFTVHLAERLDLTGGARFFWQDFSEHQTYETFIFDQGADSASGNSVHDHIFKANLSYEYFNGQRVYATFSQGFRRGGANAVPTAGVLEEPSALESYKPDRVDNFEVGVKGRTGVGIRYSADVFYINWKDPQIGTATLNDFPVVVNAPRARSRGAEFELHSPLLTPALDLGLDYALADATLTRSFCYPVGNGGGGVVDCGITGDSGSRLPGSPKSSASATLTYNQVLSTDSRLVYSLNATYKSSIVNNLPNVRTPVVNLPGYSFLNADITYDLPHLTVSAYCSNLLDHRAVYSVDARLLPVVGPFGTDQTISRPREIGIRLGYHW